MEQIDKLIDEFEEDIVEVGNMIVGETVGVAQATTELRKALKELDAKVKRGELADASAFGYNEIASAFIFLQRALGGLNQADNQKSKLIQNIAARHSGIYEEVVPYVDAKLAKILSDRK